MKRFVGLRGEERKIIDGSRVWKFGKVGFENVDVVNMVIGKSVKIGKEKGIVKGSRMVVDGRDVSGRGIGYERKDYMIERVKRVVGEVVKVE